MIENKKLKEVLDKTSGMIPEMLKTTTCKNEEIAALLGMLALRLEWLNEIAEDSGHPEFDENFYLIRMKIHEVFMMLTEKIQ